MSEISRSSLFVILFAAFFAAVILLSARRGRTSERHTLSWLLVCLSVVALAVWRDVIDVVAKLMGIYYPPSALFFLCLGALLTIVYRLSLEVTTQKSRMRRLAQEVALLGADVDGQSRTGLKDPAPESK